MSVELTSEQDKLLSELYTSVKRQQEDYEELRKSGTADSYNGIQHQEGLIKDGFEKAEKLNIPFPSVVRTFISAIPQDFKRVWLTNCFLFSSNLSKEEAKKIAEEYGIDNFDLSDWWEMPG